MGGLELNTHTLPKHTHLSTHISIQPNDISDYNSFPCGLSVCIVGRYSIPLSLSIRCLCQLFPPTTTIVPRYALWVCRHGCGSWEREWHSTGLKQKLVGSHTVVVVVFFTHTGLSASEHHFFHLCIYHPDQRGNKNRKTDKAVSPIVFSFSKLLHGWSGDGMALSVQKMTFWLFVGGEQVMGSWGRYFKTELPYRMNCGSQSKLSLALFIYPFFKHVQKRAGEDCELK